MIEGQMENNGELSRIWVKDIREDDDIRGIYLVKIKRVGQTKRGDAFLSITLMDRTGEVECRIWEKALELSSLFKEGDILEVEGHASLYRNQVQLTISSLKLYEQKVDPSIFLETTSRDIDEMMTRLKKIIRRVKDPHLKILFDRFLSDRSFTEDFKRAPAAKHFHHNYIGGLLEHTLSVCEMSIYAFEHYPNLNGELLLTGAFLHDIGKIKEFNYTSMIDYSDAGRLLGHVVLGVEMVEENINRIRGFPFETALKLKHMILSHHGQFEFGSPKRPKFLEAFVLHFIDDIDAKMNGLNRYMEKDSQDGNWTNFNQMFERYFLKGEIFSPRKEDVPLTDSTGQKVLFESSEMVARQQNEE